MDTNRTSAIAFVLVFLAVTIAAFFIIFVTDANEDASIPEVNELERTPVGEPKEEVKETDANGIEENIDESLDREEIIDNSIEELDKAIEGLSPEADFESLDDVEEL